MSVDYQDIIDAIDTAILAIAQGQMVKSYTIGGRQLERMSLDELRLLRREYAGLLRDAAETGGMQFTKGCYRSAQHTSDALATRAMVFRPSTLDEATRSVDAVLATENPVTLLDPLTGRMIQEILIVKGAEHGDSLPLLDDHQRAGIENVVGSVRNIRVEDGQLVGTLFFADTQRGRDAFDLVRHRHLTAVSSGYLPLEFDDIPAGTARAVGGRNYTAANRTLRITGKWALREISLVVVGADGAAKIRGKHGQAPATSGAKTMDGIEELDDQSTAATAVAGSTRTAPDLHLYNAEAARVSQIRKLAGDVINPELVRRAETEGWDIQKAQDEFLKALRQRSEPAGTYHVHARGHQTTADITERAIGASYAIRAGINPVDKTATEAVRKEQEQVADMVSRHFDRISMFDGIRAIAQARGASLPLGTHRALQEIMSGRSAVSMADVANIFSHSVNLVILQSYTDAMDSTIGWVSEANVKNFGTQERVQMGATSGMDKLPRGGKAKHATLSDNKETYKIARYAEQFIIDEQDIIDDNQNAMTVVPKELAAEAARLRPDLVYSILLANAALADTVALFHATHANLGEAGSVLGAASLQAGITAMLKQQQGGRNINLMAQHLVVPPDLLFTGRVLLASAERRSDDTLDGTGNPLNSLGIQLHSDNRIGVAGVTDPATGTVYTGTATNWFLFANPGQAPTIEIGYLNGQRTPVVRNFVLDRGQWGIGYDIKMDIGAKALDYRGMYKATGAS